MNALVILLAALSIWDYPARQPLHERLRRDLLKTIQTNDAVGMAALCEHGVKLLPDDPTWRYNQACALAKLNKKKEAFDKLEEAIDLGFREADQIKADKDFAPLANERRFLELVEYAREMHTRPIMFGPLATVAATGSLGVPTALGAQNLSWDFDFGCFVAHMQMAAPKTGGNWGDLYMNRDAGHSPLDVAKYPGLTSVRLDADGRERQMDMALPNILFPLPTFGNASLAFTQGPFWRSLPRALVTTELNRLKSMTKFYLSNQVWVFPICWDAPPLGTNGDVCASLTPYFIATQGRSFSDVPYVRLALDVSRSLQPQVKNEIVKRGLLAPTVITLIRKSFTGVTDEETYLSPKAHPTAFPPAQAVDTARLRTAAQKMTKADIPPLAPITVEADHPPYDGPMPEAVYGTAFAWSYVLRADAPQRTFTIRAGGDAAEYRFVQTHGAGVDVKLDHVDATTVRVTLDRRGLSPTNRLDIAVFARNAGTKWGAPSYVSFARMDKDAPYSDPFLTNLPSPLPKKPPQTQKQTK